VDEQLLGRRIHPGASRQAANPTIADVQAWFDGGVRRNVVVPTSIRLPIEYVRSCWRAPLGWWTGLVCSAVVVPTVLARRARVLGGRLRRRIRGGVDES
jgi:hypothetical protein